MIHYSLNFSFIDPLSNNRVIHKRLIFTLILTIIDKKLIRLISTIRMNTKIVLSLHALILQSAINALIILLQLFSLVFSSLHYLIIHQIVLFYSIRDFIFHLNINKKFKIKIFRDFHILH